MADDIVIVGSDGKEYPFPSGTDPKAIAGYFDAVKVKPVKRLQASEAKQKQAPLFGSPMAPLKTPGAGFLQSGIGAVAGTASLGGVSPAPTSPEQTLVEGGATAAAMMAGGIGAGAMESLGAKMLTSGFGPKMIGFFTKPLLRTAGSAMGGATGSLAYSGVTAAAGLEGAPKSVGEAATRAREAGEFGAVLQIGAEALVPAAKYGVGKLWEQVQKAALSSKTAQNARKLEGLKEQLTGELKRVNILEIRDAQAQEIQKVSGEIVGEMGLPRSPEQLKDLGVTIENRVNAKLDQRMKAIYGELDNLARASQTKVDGSGIAETIIQAAKEEPRGQGVARPFTKPTSRFSEIVKAASSGQKAGEVVGYTDKAGKTVLGKGGEKPPSDDLTEAFRVVMGPKNKEIPLDAMMKARGTISREIANPATDDETRGLLQKILKPWDARIKSGLTEINPGLAVKWDVAQDVWHKGKIIQDKVVMERLKSAGVRSLTAEIQPNAPRNVEQMRLLFNEAFPKPQADGLWKDLQRAKVEELMGTDLAEFGQNYRKYGNTMNRLFQTPEEKATALRLVTMSDDFAHLRRNPSVKNDQKIQALEASISLLESGGTNKPIVKQMTDFLQRPHILMYTAAGALGGHAYGPVGIAGALAGMAGFEAIGKRAVPALIRAAEHPYEGGRLVTSLNAWIKDGNPNTSANLARALVASYSVGDAAQRADAQKKQQEAPDAAQTGQK